MASEDDSLFGRLAQANVHEMIPQGHEVSQALFMQLLGQTTPTSVPQSPPPEYRPTHEPIAVPASHDRLLLRTPDHVRVGPQGHEFPTKLNSCPWGRKCAARKGVPGAPEGGLTLCAYMLPNEWEHFLKTGEQPEQPKPCILCIRNVIEQSVNHLYLHQVSPSANFRMQSFQNPVDCEDGYRRDVCICPDESFFTGLVAPICALRYPLLKAVRSPDPPLVYGEECWRVDQSALEYF